MTITEQIIELENLREKFVASSEDLLAQSAFAQGEGSRSGNKSRE